MKTLLFSILLVLGSSCIFAQNFVVTNVTLFDGETVVENTSVLVEDGIITKVGGTIVYDKNKIDGTGKFLMPAMTNSHVHAFNALSLSQAAKAGVLNLLDMHGMEQMQAMLANLNDSINYARYYYAGAAATVPGGHGTQYGFPTPTLTKVDEAEAFVADRINAGAHYLKIIVEPWKETLSHEVVKALIDAAHKRELNAVVHISKVEDAQKVLRNNADGLVHIWFDKEMDDVDLKKLTSEKEFFVIPTLLTTNLMLKMLNKNTAEGAYLSTEAIGKEVKRLYDAGIPILAGTDPPNAGINYGTDLYKELDLLSKAGIPNIDVLKAATSHPAHYFKLGNTGFIKEGFKADLILLDADPVTDIQNISAINTIWKEGNEIE